MGPSSLTRCASAISVSGKVCATGSEKRPDSINSPISASAWEAEHALTDGHVRNARAELVDDARRLVA